jgi:alpha-tubulin suppressor-like RCC1 family protein
MWSDPPPPNGVLVDVGGLDAGIRTIAAGADHSCATTLAGEVEGWGNNAYGQLGAGASGFGEWNPDPIEPFALEASVRAVSLAVRHSCALNQADELWCWGSNETGQLGNGSTSNVSSPPVEVARIDGGWRSVAAGALRMCAVTQLGALFCWGGGQYLNGEYRASNVPDPIVDW